ncbi:hypothetical protein [Algisphaera agarilytica]|uniref:Uncharacterized protein n=1 Tax=Algisphaera agarilytica TaxID=1385975 RepID=A0A7X0LLE0_9BACT|nr:hypothetical protein [Algisphaera agarilytica]MBB6430814.1 hypothetical protein [Algisphaera agarilytica]
MLSRKPKSKQDDKKKPSAKPRLSWVLATAVIALQAGMLTTLAVTTQWQPPKVRMIEALWAWAQNASFYPLLLLLIGGPLFTWMACSLDRKKFGVMTTSWAVFGLTLVIVFGAEAQVMFKTLWQQIPV